MKKRITYVLAAILCVMPLMNAGAREKIANGLEIDKTVHNFGDILLSDGAVSCSFTITNTGNKPRAIYGVYSSCGCTDVEWTKEPILPGKSGKISATYSNDEGPYPFEKTLTVYLSDVNSPVILRLRGVSRKKELPLEEAYPVHLGALGLRETEIKAGNMEQGMQKSDEIGIANLSSRPMKLSFENVSPQLSLRISENPVPAGKTAKISYTVKSDRQLWGKNHYWFTPVVNGVRQSPVSIWAITKENFSSLTKEEKAAAPRPMFKTSSFSIGKTKAGKKFEAAYEFANEGKTTLVIHKIDMDSDRLRLVSAPSAVKPGCKGTIKVLMDTDGMDSGEVLNIISVYTNAPTRPLVDLFITGWID